MFHLELPLGVAIVRSSVQVWSYGVEAIIEGLAWICVVCFSFPNHSNPRERWKCDEGQEVWSRTPAFFEFEGVLGQRVYVEDSRHHKCGSCHSQLNRRTWWGLHLDLLGLRCLYRCVPVALYRADIFCYCRSRALSVSPPKIEWLWGNTFTPRPAIDLLWRTHKMDTRGER